MEPTLLREEETLLRILPNEIWLATLNQLSPNAKEEVSNSSAFFHRLLTHNRHIFLFPKVFQIFAAHYEHDLSKILPTHQTRLRIAKAVQTLRSVCKDWRFGVDNFYENLQRHMAVKDTYRTVDTTGSWVDLKFSCSFPERFQSYIDHFGILGPSDLNPILGRSVDFHVGPFYSVPPSPRDLADEFNNNIKTFMAKFGQHIWYCHVSMDIPCEALEFYNDVYIWLSFMPNLRIFHLGMSKNAYASRRQHHEWLYCKKQLNFPTMKYLKYFSVNGMHLKVVEHFLINFRQLEAFEMHETRRFPFDITHVHWETSCPHQLKTLSIGIFKLQTFENLERLSHNFLWKLSTLPLQFHDVSLQRSRVFAFAENWKDTLTSVVIGLPRARNYLQYTDLVKDRERALNLPRVEYFKVYIENATGIDFILPMKETLKELTIACVRSSPLRYEILDDTFKDELVSDLVINFNMSERETLNVLGNNIWTLFPNLENVNVELVDHQEYKVLRKKTVLKM